MNRITYGLEAALASYNAAQITIKKCTELASRGYRFVPGNNPFLDKTKKWRDKYDCVRVALTNSRYHGHCEQTMWAVRLK